MCAICSASPIDSFPLKEDAAQPPWPDEVILAMLMREHVLILTKLQALCCQRAYKQSELSKLTTLSALGEVRDTYSLQMMLLCRCLSLWSR